MKLKWICCLLIASLLLFGMVVQAAPEQAEGFDIPIDIMLNGDFILCTQKPFVENGITYLPLRALSDALSGSIAWDAEMMAATFTMADTSFLFYSDGRDSVVNGTTVPGSAALLYKDLLFVPVRVICESLGYAVEWDAFHYIVHITAPDVVTPAHCKDFSYTLNDLSWLSRIVHVECGAESIATRIGIANTVLNRVKSPLYPNTIPEAILDKKHGVQFPPAHTSKINCVPSATSMIAAKCALNGVSLVEDAVAFVNVNYLKSSWAANNMKHTTTIGVVAFYSF